MALITSLTSLTRVSETAAAPAVHVLEGRAKLLLQQQQQQQQQLGTSEGLRAWAQSARMPPPTPARGSFLRKEEALFF